LINSSENFLPLQNVHEVSRYRRSLAKRRKEESAVTLIQIKRTKTPGFPEYGD
jgi:hypothetical protein